MWFWFCAVLTYYHREIIDRQNKSYGHNYLETAERAKEMVAILGKEYSKLLHEAQKHQKTMAKN